MANGDGHRNFCKSLWALGLVVVAMNLLLQGGYVYWLKYPLQQDLSNSVSCKMETSAMEKQGNMTASSDTDSQYFRTNMTNMATDNHDEHPIPRGNVSATITTSEMARYVFDQARGIQPIYLELLKEAERRSAVDFETSHTRGDKGVVIGPTEGEFRFTIDAMKNAKRIRYILEDDNTIKIALMTSANHLKIIQKHCSFGNTTKEFEFTCRLWANGTLFDDVIETKDGEFLTNDNHSGPDASSNHWLKALGGYRLAPYTMTLFLDSDAFPCPGFQDLFYIAKAPKTGWNPWQLTTTRNADLAIGLDQYPWGDNLHWLWAPGDLKILNDFQTFRVRNTGSVLFHFERQLAHTFAHFIPLVSEHVYNNVATVEHKVVNDQCPFRVALYLFKRLHPDFNEHIIPMHSSCRAYPGADYAATDAFLVGMLPIQQDGKYCSECSCSPCRVAHFRIYNLHMNGKMGWEESVDPNLNRSKMNRTQEVVKQGQRTKAM